MKLKLLLPAFLLCSTLFAQTQRMVLLEEFTNASCAPCAAANPNYHTLLAANTAKAVSVKYQTNWPGYDPMNVQTASEVANRVSYYSVSGVPDVFMDGVNKSSPTNMSQTIIDNEYAVTSPFSMNLTHWLNAANDSIFINCTITCSQNVTMTTPVLRVALIEKAINFGSAPGTNGETVFYTVMRKMYPDPKGTPLATSWIVGNTKTVSFSAKLPSYIYDKTQIGTVAWIQDESNKSVKQAANTLSASTPLALAPIADFSTSETSSCDGIIQLQDNSALFPASWLWDFGDGTTSTLKNPAHKYNVSGNYTVTLNVSNGYGSNQLVKSSYISVNLSGSAPTGVGAKRCGSGVVNLSATAAGSGTLNWYDASGTLVNTGNTYSPSITGVANYYVAEITPNIAQSAGPADYSFGAGAYFSANNAHGQYFDILKPCSLMSVKVFADTAGSRSFQVLNPSGAVIKTLSANLTTGANVINLNMPMATGSGYFIKVSSTFVDLYRNSASASYPYSNGVVSITGNDANAVYYYFFYNWQTVLNPCASPSVLVAGVDSCSSVGIADVASVNSFNVFPNPSNGSFTVSFNAPAHDNYILRISNTLGQSVYEESLPGFSGMFSKQIDLAFAPKGIYMLSILNSKSETVKKLIVQ